jgi:hypothetical protein
MKLESRTLIHGGDARLCDAGAGRVGDSAGDGAGIGLSHGEGRQGKEQQIIGRHSKTSLFAAGALTVFCAVIDSFATPRESSPRRKPQNND